MPKVVHRIINHKYISIRTDLLIEGKAVPFDCYIKRFDDYVIIIEAGTFITKELYEKVFHNEVIYILKHDIEKVKEYNAAYQAMSEHRASNVRQEASIAAVYELNDKLQDDRTLEERLHRVYATTVELMQSFFETADEKLPLEALQICTAYLVEYVNSDKNIMPFLLKMMPEEYSTAYHSVNVAFFSAILSKAIRVTKEDKQDIAMAALLHDIGKIRISETILLKPGSLEQEEFEIMKHHSDDGFAILQKNGVTNQKILNGVRYHHEKLDGTGYPHGLHGKIIPKFARIIGMCDVFDALTTKRTFRQNYTSFEALILMKKEMNAQFDEHYIDTFIRLLR